MQRWPGPKTTKKLPDRVRGLTSQRHSGRDIEQLIAELTPVLRGWGNYFRTGNADREFKKMDASVFRSLQHWHTRRGRQRRRGGSFGPAISSALWVCIDRAHREVPGACHTRRSSLSRVPENGTHGLKRD
jgi:hypothetical protein